MEAIEADAFERLPGNFFTRSFVIQYARLLELDEEEIETELDELLEAKAEPDPLEQMAAAQRSAGPPLLPALAGLARSVAAASRLGSAAKALKWATSLAARPSGSMAWLAVAVLACSGLYAWWQRGHRAPPVTVAQQAAPLVRVEAPPPAPALSEPEPPAVEPAQPLTVDVGASRPTYVQVTSDGKLIFTGTVEPNQPRTFQGSRAMRLFTGNAGALEVRLNGRSLGPVGPEGQGRVVDLTTQGPKIHAPHKPRFVYDPLG